MLGWWARLRQRVATVRASCTCPEAQPERGRIVNVGCPLHDFRR